MTTYVGLQQCLEHSVAGGETPAFLAFDKVEGATMTGEGGEPNFNIGAGGQVIKYRGLYTPGGNARTSVQTDTLLACAIPATLGSLPTVIKIIQGGLINVASMARIHSDCYLDHLKLSCSEQGILRAEYVWRALFTENDIIAEAEEHIATTPLPWHAAAATVAINDGDPSAVKLQNWETDINNNLQAQTSQDEKTTDYEIVPEWFDPGEYRASARIDVRVPIAMNLAAVAGDVFFFTWIGVNAETVPGTFTVDGASGDGFCLSSDAIEIFRGADAVVYRLEGQSAPFDLDALTAGFAA